MRKPKSFKDFILGILFVAVLGCVAYFIADLLKTEVVPGDIAVQSGDTEITALQRVTAEQRKDGSFLDCERFDIQTDSADFPVPTQRLSGRRREWPRLSEAHLRRCLWRRRGLR